MTKLTKKQSEMLEVMRKYGKLTTHRTMSRNNYKTLMALAEKGMAQHKPLGNGYVEFSLIVG